MISYIKYSLPNNVASALLLRFLYKKKTIKTYMHVEKTKQKKNCFQLTSSWTPLLFDNLLPSVMTTITDGSKKNGHLP